MTRCRRMMSPTWKMTGWSTGFLQKMEHHTIWLDWSVIFRVEQ